MSTKYKKINITQHGKSRTKSRLGLRNRQAKQKINKAFREGLKHSECTGELELFANRVFFRSGQKANNLRIHKHNVYIFAGNNLITVYQIPENLWELADRLEEEKAYKREMDRTFRMIKK